MNHTVSNAWHISNSHHTSQHGEPDDTDRCLVQGTRTVQSVMNQTATRVGERYRAALDRGGSHRYSGSAGDTLFSDSELP